MHHASRPITLPIRLAAALLLVASALLASGSAASQSMLSQPTLSPQAVLARLFTMHPVRSAWFSPPFLVLGRLTQVQSVTLSLTGELGAFKGVNALGGQDFQVRFLDGTVHVQMHLDGENRIDGLVFSDPALTVPPGSSVPGTADGRAARIDTLLAKLTHDHLFSGSVLVAARGRVLLGKGYGKADVAHGIPNTVTTEFRIGSISKQFAAMAILQLQEAGKLSIHDHLCRYISSCPKTWAAITLQQLLTHTSGFPTDYSVPGVALDPSKSITVAEALALIRRVALDRLPEAGYEYSNLNFDLLGIIVEKIAHQPYAAYLRQHILDPLLLQDTGYDSNHPDIHTHASGYSTWQHAAPFVDMSWYYAAGALYSNVVDLWHWDQALAGNVLIARTSTADMLAAHATMCAGGADACGGYDADAYGYGLVRSTIGGHRVIWHNGEVSGFKATNAFLPEDGITIIVLSNLESSGAADIIGTQLIHMMLGSV